MFRAPRPRRPAPAAALIRSVVLSAALATTLVACSGEDDAPPAPEPEPLALADLDTTGLVVQRDAFCDAVDDRALEAAVGGDAELVTWGNGENLSLPGGVEDLAHENGCRWTADAEAGAWVYVPPVPAANAEAYVAAAAGVEGCETLEGQPAYGAPSLAQSCVTENSTEVSFRGLFGDAWLTCTLTEATPTEADDLVERASAWCAAVAVAAAE